MSETISTLEDADIVATRIAELELEISLINTRFDLRKQRLEQRKAEACADLCAERDALYDKLDGFAAWNSGCLKKERPIPGGSYKIITGRISTKVDDDVFDAESESERFGVKLYTARPDLNAIGKLLKEGEVIEGAILERGKDKVKVSLDKKLAASRLEEAKKAEAAEQ